MKLKFLIPILWLIAYSAFGAVPEYKSFFGTGGIVISSNPPTGAIIIDGSGISGGVSAATATNIVTSKLGSSTNALGYGFTNTASGATLFVDSVFGVNATAVRGDASKPYAGVSNALAAVQNGDTVVIRPGLYPITGIGYETNCPLLLWNKKNVTIIGMGGSSSVILSNNSHLSTMLIHGGTNITVRGITFIGKQTNGILQGGVAGICLDGDGQHLVFNDLVLINQPNHGFLHEKTGIIRDMAVSGCSFINIGSTNGVITSNPDGTAIVLGDLDSRVVGNYFENNLRDVELFSSLASADNLYRGILVSGNVSQNPIQHFFCDYGTNTINLDITDNVVSQNGTNLTVASGCLLIALNCGRQINISGNTFYGPGSSAVGVNGITTFETSVSEIHAVNIANNSFYGLAATLALWRNNGTAAKNSGISFRDNMVVSNKFQAMNIAGTDLVISGNTFRDFGLGGDACIYVGLNGTSDSSTNVQICNNLFANNTYTGAREAISVSPNAYRTVINGNRYNNGVTGATDTGVGTLIGVSEITVSSLTNAVTNAFFVIYGSPVIGQVLTATTTGGKVAWSNAPSGSGATALSNLTDVVVTNMQGGDFLQWNHGMQKWTNFPSFFSAVVYVTQTNIFVGTNLEQFATIKTNISFKLVYTGTPQNGETVNLSVSNYGSSVIYMTNSAYDPTVASNVTLFAIPALSVRDFKFMSSTNFNLGVQRWELIRSLQKESELAAAGSVVLLTNSDSSIITVSNTFALFSLTNSVVVTNVTASTSLLGNQIGTFTLPANLLQPGTVIKCEFAGEISTPGSPAGMTNRVTLGGSILATNTVPFVASMAGDPWSINFTITCQTAGASGTVICEGLACQPTSAGGVSSMRRLRLASGAVTVDTTGTLALGFDLHPGTTTTGVKLNSGFGMIVR